MMLREIKKFSQKTEEIILIIQSSAEDATSHYEKIEKGLENFHMTIISEANIRKKKAIAGWLSNTDPISNHSTAKSKRAKTTGDWFIKGETYSEWLKTPNSFLWLHGIPGCGKSVLWYVFVLTRDGPDMN